MISIERCKEILGEPQMADSEVEKLREALYAMVESILDNHFEENGKIDTYAKSSHLLPSIISKAKH
jgi:hypothetical protein